MSASSVAARLHAAARAAAPVAPDDDEPLTEDDGYAVQGELLELHLADGARVVGWKLGLTSLAKQVQMGVDVPVHGFLLDRMLVPPGSLSLTGLIHPRVEPELAFRLGAPLAGQGVSRDDVLEATETILPALEILDSRYMGFRFGLGDVIADNTSAALVVLGNEGVSPSALDPALEAVVLSIDGAIAATAAGAAVLGHPADAVAWLASRRPLAAGELVLTGALTEALPLAGVEHVLAEFTTLGRLELEVLA